MELRRSAITGAAAHSATDVKPKPGIALVVGGSLVGLAAAVRLARCGMDVTVFERGEGFGAEGAGLGVDRRRLSAITGVSAMDGHDVPAIPVITTNRESTTWSAIYRWLRDVADRQGRIEVRAGSAVTGVSADGNRGRVELGKQSFEGDFVIGADGRGSIVRRAIAPERPIARYAGYGLWRGMLDERSLPTGILPGRSHPVGVCWADNQRLVAYEVPSPTGSVQPGERAVNWAWYDLGLTELFAAGDCLRGEEVIRSLRPSELSSKISDLLAARAEVLWPEPWRTAIVRTIAAQRVFATPIAEYLPIRLVAGPLAIIGDAAHLASPMTGAGLITGLDDVEALGRAIEADLAGGPPALPAYETSRLAAARALAMSSIRWSQSYVKQTQAKRRT